MNRSKIIFTIILVIVFLSSAVLFTGTAAAASTSKKTIGLKPIPISISDALAWKDIQVPIVSPDGQWFAYHLVPDIGDCEVMVTHIKQKKEYRFPIGDAARISSNSGRQYNPERFKKEIDFSEDAQWLAFKIYPNEKDTRNLKKQKKTVETKLGLLNLVTGEKKEFDRVEAFAFSGENPGLLALHKYAGGDGSSSTGHDDEKKDNQPTGKDLILVELSTGMQYNIGNVSEFAFNKTGSHLVWLVDAADQSGNGVAGRCLASGTVQVLDSGPYFYKKLSWTEKGDAFAVLKGEDNQDYEDKLYRVLGFKDLQDKEPTRIEYDPANDKTFPSGMTISPNRQPQWTENFDGILFGIHEVKQKEKETKEKEKGKKAQENKKLTKDKQPAEKDTAKEKDDKELADLVIWHWQDERLQSQQQKMEMEDKNFSFLAIYRVQEKKFIRLADEHIRRLEIAPKTAWAIGFDKTPYELQGDLDGRRYEDIYAIDLATGKRKRAVEKCRWYFGPSFEGTHFLYFRDAHFYTYNMEQGISTNISKGLPVSFVKEDNDQNIENPPKEPIGWAKDGKYVLLYDNWDAWKVPVHGGGGLNLTGHGRDEGIRYEYRFRLDPEEKGIDLEQPQYFRIYGEWTKRGGLAVIRNCATQPVVERLHWDDAFYGYLIKPGQADIYLYTRETYKDYPDYHAAGPALADGHRLTEANPQQQEFLWTGGVRLIDYQSKQGKRLQAALHLPAGYRRGQAYPTIVLIYEKLSDRLNHYSTPRVRGFNTSLYTSWGYAVLMPDIVYQVNEPGMSAVWCVLPAVEAAVATGIVDKERLGIHGHSWGGYQTAFLITQGDTFRAAAAGAPLTNMISMYSSIYWNIGFANQPLFESGQGRFYGGFWDNLEAYTRNSPVYYADKVRTPLLLLHNDNDGAVDWNQGIEFFNALRQLQKPVVLLQYKGENHSLQNPANKLDYTIRMRQFFDFHLMGKEAPTWYSKGISFLEHREHIEELAKIAEERKN